MIFFEWFTEITITLTTCPCQSIILVATRIKVLITLCWTRFIKRVFWFWSRSFRQESSTFFGSSSMKLIHVTTTGFSSQTKSFPSMIATTLKVYTSFSTTKFEEKPTFLSTQWLIKTDTTFSLHRKILSRLTWWRT